MKHSKIALFTLLLIAFSTLSNFTFVHPIHISVTEIYYDEEKNNLEIAVKIFADDLEDGIKKLGATNIRLSQDKESEKTDDWVVKYLTNNLNIIVNNQKIETQFLGKEYEQYALWSYLEVKNLSEVNSLTIKNTILQSVFKDQKNLVHFYKNKKRIQTSILNHHKTEVSIHL